MTYVALDDLKSHIEVPDTASDPELTFALNGAVDLIDSFCKRHFREIDTNDSGAKTTRVFTAKSARLVLIDDAAAVDSVEDRQTATSAFETVASDDYEARPGNASADDRPFTRLRRVTSWWPKDGESVRVTAWFGWPTTPDIIKEATLLQASRFYRRRESPLGISQVPATDGGGMRLLSKLDADVELMLASYRRVAW